MVGQGVWLGYRRSGCVVGWLGVRPGGCRGVAWWLGCWVAERLGGSVVRSCVLGVGCWVVGLSVGLAISF